MMITLDHIAIAATDLEAGVEYVEKTLGVKMVGGGQHPLMGTHNKLLGLADGLYLEVIAIDPNAQPPAHPRWFDLDNFSGAPRISNWIMRTENLAETLNVSPAGAGVPVALSRGDLNWEMAVPDDGKLPFDNGFPALIEWKGRAHPAERLPQSGCQLIKFSIHHPKADDLAKSLSPMLNDDRIAFLTGPIGFQADFETPLGRVTLR